MKNIIIIRMFGCAVFDDRVQPHQLRSSSDVRALTAVNLTFNTAGKVDVYSENVHILENHQYLF